VLRNWPVWSHVLRLAELQIYPDETVQTIASSHDGCPPLASIVEPHAASCLFFSLIRSDCIRWEQFMVQIPISWCKKNNAISARAANRRARSGYHNRGIAPLRYFIETLPADLQSAKYVESIDALSSSRGLLASAGTRRSAWIMSAATVPRSTFR